MRKGREAAAWALTIEVAACMAMKGVRETLVERYEEGVGNTKVEEVMEKGNIGESCLSAIEVTFFCTGLVV